VVPSVEIDVENDHASSGETGQKKPEKEDDEIFYKNIIQNLILDYSEV
jgi:hypothetical protein